MTGKTHLVAGIVAGELLTLSTHQTDIYSIIFSITISALGGLLPDIDHPQATVSNSSKVLHKVSETVAAVTQHRGLTHTLAFTLLLTAIMFHFMTGKIASAAYICCSFEAGLLSHLILDTFNGKGIMWLWPLSKKHFHIAKIHTGAKQESFFRFCLNLIATFMLGYILILSIIQFVETHL